MQLYSSIIISAHPRVGNLTCLVLLELRIIFIDDSMLKGTKRSWVPTLIVFLLLGMAIHSAAAGNSA